MLPHQSASDTRKSELATMQNRAPETPDKKPLSPKKRGKARLVTTPEVMARLQAAKIFFSREPHVPASRLRPTDTLSLDSRSEIEPYTGIFAGRSLPLSMGSFSYTNSDLGVGIRIGRYCSLAAGIRVMGNNHPIDRISSSPWSYGSYLHHSNIFAAAVDFDESYAPAHRFSTHDVGPILENDVWIGQDVLLANGITIGTGAVVAAGSVVTKSVPPYHIVGGAKAQVIRLRFPETTIEAMLKSEWWRYHFTQFADLPITNPLEFCKAFEDRKPALTPYAPEPLILDDLLGDDG